MSQILQNYFWALVVVLIVLYLVLRVAGKEQLLAKAGKRILRAFGNLLSSLLRGGGRLLGQGFTGLVRLITDGIVWCIRNAYHQIRFGRPAPPRARPHPRRR